MRNNELTHYGVLGMRWGKRKAIYTTNSKKVSTAKSQMEKAKAAMKERKNTYLNDNSVDNYFDKTYNTTYKNLIKGGMKKGKAENRALKEAMSKTQEIDRNFHSKYKSEMKVLKDNYKQAKKAYKQENKKTNEEYTKKAQNIDRYVFNEATRNKVNKLMNSGMKMSDARKQVHKEAWRNTAAFLVVAGALTISELKR